MIVVLSTRPITAPDDLAALGQVTVLDASTGRSFEHAVTDEEKPQPSESPSQVVRVSRRPTRVRRPRRPLAGLLRRVKPAVPAAVTVDSPPRPQSLENVVVAVTSMLAGTGDCAVVCADEGSRQLAWHVSRRVPDIPVVDGVRNATDILQGLHRQGLPWTAGAVASLLDPLRPSARQYSDIPRWNHDTRAVVAIVADSVDDADVRQVQSTLAHMGLAAVVIAPGHDDRPLGDVAVPLQDGLVLEPYCGSEGYEDWTDRLSQALQAVSADVVHVCEPRLADVVIAACDRLTSEQGRPALVYDPDRGHSRHGRDEWLADVDLSPFDLVIATQDSLAASLRERGATECVVVKPIPEFMGSPPTTSFRTRLSLKPDVPLVLMPVPPSRSWMPTLGALLTQNPRLHIVVNGGADSATDKELPDAVRWRYILMRHRAPLSASALDSVDAALLVPDRNSTEHARDDYSSLVLGGVPVVFDAQALPATTTRTADRVVACNDVDGCVRALREVLADAEPRTDLADPVVRAHRWEREAEQLRESYARFHLPSRPPAVRASPRSTERVFIGPRNTAGQGHSWAVALRRAGVDATSYQVLAPTHPWAFAADMTISTDQLADEAAQLSLVELLLRDATHLLLEAGSRPIHPAGGGASGVSQAERAGVQVCLLFHGSEVRNPIRHAHREPWSPFADPANDALTRGYISATRRMHAWLAEYDGPGLVSTPDLLDDVPWAAWLPVSVDTTAFSPDGRELARARVPVVLHAPSSAPLKGSKHIDPVLRRLHAEGVIRYERVRGVEHAKMPSVIRQADIVVDQVLMNLIGVKAAESMAAGRVVVAHMTERLAERYPRRPPVVDATPDTLEDVIRGLAADPDRRAELGADSRRYAEAVHDGRLSSSVISTALGLCRPELGESQS